ncbi:Hypothetical predicted protein [Mytilus galloprovincialis]|uniref:Uncharacterized protein n=1 Tax=Mytilus galloprovincialis TaxID=29158 RepID=A0A8B6EW83_MYTGA|nr:Hypothetical predicted protein [Mytilus galloprovincialis]
MNQLVGIGTFELKEEVSENDLMLLPTQDLVKYENEPVVCKAAGISTTDRNITNHSGKVTCCTTLFNAGFSDSTVKSRSGHRSTAVDTYKRPLETLQDNVSKALQPPVPTSKNVKQENDLSIAKSNQHSFEDKINDNSTMTINVPNCINKVVIFKNGKRYCLEI